MSHKVKKQNKSVNADRSDGESASGEALPEGWAYAILDDVGEWKGGGTPRKSNFSYWTNGKVPWVSPKDMKRFFIDEAKDRITTAAVEESSAQLLPKNSVLVVTRSSILQRILPVAINTVPVATNQDLKALLPHKGVDTKYIAYLLKANDYDLREECSKDGTTVASIDLPKLKAYSFGLAPKAEQSRIVSAIESFQGRSSRARILLSEVGTLVGQLRQSVLRNAFSGKLTADWRRLNPDVQPASELLERVRTERRQQWETDHLAKYKAKGKKPPKSWQDKYKEPDPFDKSELPELPASWCWTNLVTIANIQSGVTLGSKKRDGEAYVSRPYLRVANVQRGYLNLDEVKTVEVTEEKAAAIALQAGDILFTEGGDRDKLGRGCIWKNEIEGCIHQNHVYSARLIVSDFMPELVSHYSNEFGKDYFFKNASQTVNLASINKTHLSGLMLPVIPVEEQQVLLERLSKLLTACEVVEAALATSEAELTQLNQSILAKAFRGELVPQDPRDESASELLARIRQTRLIEPRKKRPKTMTPKKEAKQRTNLAEVIRSSQGNLSPEKLFNVAGFDDASVEEFFLELRTEIRAKRIKEIRPTDADVLLGVDK